MTLSIEDRNKALVHGFMRGDTLRSLADDHDLTYEGVRFALISSLGPKGYARAKADRATVIATRKAEAARERVAVVRTAIETQYAEDPTAGLSLAGVTALYVDPERKINAEDCRTAYSEFLADLSPAEAARIAAATRLSRGADHARWGTDEDVLEHLDRAYAALSATETSLTLRNYEEWRRHDGNAPSAQTVVYRLSDDGRWSTAAALVDPTASARSGGGYARLWDDDDLQEAIQRFLAWAARRRKEPTRSAYLEYTSGLKSPMPSLSLIRVRLGAWGNVIHAKTS
jgi:hypothetical protein